MRRSPCFINSVYKLVAYIKENENIISCLIFPLLSSFFMKTRRVLGLSSFFKNNDFILNFVSAIKTFNDY